MKVARFSQHFGRRLVDIAIYDYHRVGISSAPEEFQRRHTGILDGLQGVEVIVDDIILCVMYVGTQNLKP